METEETKLCKDCKWCNVTVYGTMPRDITLVCTNTKCGLAKCGLDPVCRWEPRVGQTFEEMKTSKLEEFKEQYKKRNEEAAKRQKKPLWKKLF